MNVDSYEEFSFTVPGVPPSAPVKVVLPTTTKATKQNPKPRVQQMRPALTLSNAKFVAIYNGGQTAGVSVKVGGGKLTPLTQPLMYMDRAAASLGSHPPIVLQNESSAPRTVSVFVGSELPKGANKTELIGGSSAGTRSAASATKNAAARASRPKGKVRGKKKKKK